MLGTTEKVYRPEMSWEDDLIDIMTTLDAFYDRLQDGYEDISRNSANDALLIKCMDKTGKAFNILLTVVEDLKKIEGEE